MESIATQSNELFSTKAEGNWRKVDKHCRLLAFRYWLSMYGLGVIVTLK